MDLHAVNPPRKHRADLWIESLVLMGIALLALAALLGGCLAERKQTDAASSGSPTWTTLTSGSGALTNCTNSSCHDAASPTGNLNLENDQYDTIVTNGKMDLTGTLRIVDPGSKSTSQMFLKVDTGGSMATYAGVSGTTTIGEWIDAGAPE